MADFPEYNPPPSGQALPADGWFGFALFFLVGFASLQAGYSYCLGEKSRIALLQMLALGPSAFLVNLLTPLEHVLIKNQLLISPYAGLAVQRGCEGIEGIFLLFAAMAAYRTSLRRKIWGMLAGLGLIMFLNIGRIVSLYYILRFEKGAFGLLHGYLWPGFIVLSGGLFFLWWAQKQGEGA